MDTDLLVALVGVGGTISGVFIGQGGAWLTDRGNRRREQAMRWDEGQKKLAGEILAAALKLEKNAWSTIAHLDRRPRRERLPGYTSIFLVPDVGIPGVIDEVGVSIITDAIRDGFSNLESLEVLVETFAITATPAVGNHARILVDSLWSNYGHLEAFSVFDKAADSVEITRAARDSFSNAFRYSLGISGKVASDGRPRGESS